MAANETSLVGFELLSERNLSEQQTQVLNIFGHAMQTASLESAAEAARQLDVLCPPVEQEKETNNYLWMVWEMMLNIAQSPDVTSEIQELLLSIAESLQQVTKGDINVWGNDERLWEDLPMLPMCMDAAFDDPTSEPEEFTPKSAQMWRNLNAFGARCLRSGVLAPYHQALDALIPVLEEQVEGQLEEQTSIIECRVQVACEWILYAAKPLLLWAQENIGYTDIPEEDEASYIEGGSLYHGPSTMCLQRWGFWLDRFGELGKECSGLSEEMRRSALEAAQTMRRIEASIGHTLSTG